MRPDVALRVPLGVLRRVLQGQQLGGDGRLDAQFLWTGGAANPELGGRLRLTAFSYQNNSWDEFSGTVRYRTASGGATPRLAELEVESARLLKGETSAEGGARVSLQGNAVARGSPFSVEGSVRNASIEELQRLLGVSYPVRGTLQASGRISGTPDDPRGEGSVTIRSGAAYDEPFDRLTGRIAFEDRDRYLAEASRSRAYLLRQMVLTVKVLACFAFFSDVRARVSVAGEEARR